MSKFLLAKSPLAKKGASERMEDSGPVSWVLLKIDKDMNKSPSDQKRLATTRQQVRQVKTASPLRELGVCCRVQGVCCNQRRSLNDASDL